MPALAERLFAAGIGAGGDPLEVWRALRDVEGARATVVDLYELVAAPRGLAPHELPLAERAALARATLPLVWPAFELTSGSERPGEPIVVVDYDDEWPRCFRRWRAVLAEKLGNTAACIEHVGSTSVPGLAAKPVVDLQVSVDDLAAEERYVPQLESAGLQLRSRDDEHRYFRPFPTEPRDVQVHVCAAGSPWERDHLLFRDHLRTNPDAARAYAEAKKAAATTWVGDRLAYTDAKTAVILDIMDAARATST